jgi:hypothetical protein
MNVIDFIGTDCHSALQADEIMKFMNKKNRQLSSLNVKNKTLL